VSVAYSRRAVADLRGIAAYYAGSDNPAAGEQVAARIRAVVARVERLPRSGRPVGQRPRVRVTPVLRYPYLVFYKVTGSGVQILHIRHTARQTWGGK
jgi:toxin ParE1/3/4